MLLGTFPLASVPLAETSVKSGQAGGGQILSSTTLAAGAPFLTVHFVSEVQSSTTLANTFYGIQIPNAGTISSETSLFGFTFYPSYQEWLEDEPLFTFGGPEILESDSAFEQAGRIVFCAEREIKGNREIWLYWFDPFVGDFIFVKLCNGRNPRALLDNPLNTSESDVLVFYVRLPDQRICFRQQRDRYAIEYETPIAKVSVSYIDVYLQDVVKARDGRLVVIYALHTINTGRWAYGILESALYPLVLVPDSWTSPQHAIAGGGALDSIIQYVLPFGQPVEGITPPVAWLDISEWGNVVHAILSGDLSKTFKVVGPPGTLDPAGDPAVAYNDPEEWGNLVHQIIGGSALAKILIEVGVPGTLDGAGNPVIYEIDVEEWGNNSHAIQSGTLVVVVIVIVLFDIDEWQVAHNIIPAGSSLV